MTSRNSSLDVFKFTFKDTAKGNILISMIVLIPAMFLLFGSFIEGTLMSSTPYIWFSGYFVYQVTDMNPGYFAIMILWSCLFAMRTFSFLSSKKECNVYLSLGISRNKLFYSKYLGGAVGIFGTLTAYYAFDLLFNWLENGLMIEGFTVWAFYYISTLVTCLAAYTIAVYAFVNAGNIVEGIIFTFFFGIFWPVFTAVTNQAFSAMVYGNAYGTQMYGRADFFSSDIWYLDIFGSYTEQLDKYYDYFTKADLAANGFDAPNWSGVIFAAVAVIIVTYIAGRMFRNRTSEICGFVFRSKKLYKTFFMLLGIVMGLSLMSAIPMHRVSAAIISSLLAIIFVFIGWLICDRKVPVKATVALAVMSVVFVGGCFIGYGDEVPEKSEVKAIDITADFSYLSDADPCGYGIGSNLESDVSYIDPTSVPAPYPSDNYYTTLTSENDIEWLLDIHSNLIKDGYRFGPEENTANADITIAYLLDDGSTVVRHYDNISLETYKKLLGFSDTDNGKGLMKLALTGNYEVQDYIVNSPSAMGEKLYDNYHYFGMFGLSFWMEKMGNSLSMDPTYYHYGYGEPTLSAALTDKDFSYVGMLESTNLFLAEEENLLDNKFFGALLTDIDNLTVEQRYFHSAEDEIGAVIVPKSRSYENIGTYYNTLKDYEKLKEGDKFFGDFPKLYESTIQQQEDDYYEEEWDSEVIYDDVVYSETVASDPYGSAYEENPEEVIKSVAEKGAIGEYFYVYVITKDMTNTIEYLKEAGLYDKLIKSEEKPVSVKINTTEFVFGHFYNTKDMLKASAINPKFSTYDYARFAEYMVDIFGTPEITDADIITALYDNSLMYSGKVYGGYIAEFFYADGKQVSRFVPASAVTEEIKAKINLGSAE